MRGFFCVSKNVWGTFGYLALFFGCRIILRSTDMIKVNKAKNYRNKTKEELIDELIVMQKEVDKLGKLEQECAEAYDRLKDSERKYRALFDQAADAIVVFDINTGEFLDFNDRAHQYLGYARDEFKKLKISDIEVKESPDEVQEHIQKVVEKGSDTFETKHRRKDGIIRDIFVSCKAIDLKGKKCIQSIWCDISERKKAEEKIELNQQMLIESQEEIKKFSHKILNIREEEKKNLATILHHEIGSLALSLSSGMAEIEHKIKDSEMDSALEINKINKSILKSFVSTIKELALDLRPPNLEIIGLSEVLKEYLDKCVGMGNIDIDFQHYVDDEDINTELAIVIFRIVQEAVNNIIKHAHASLAKVVLTTKKKNLLLKICDNGLGKAKMGSPRDSRMKMGLRLMKEMAESLGGNLYIKSKEGQGTEITVIIPQKNRRDS